MPRPTPDAIDGALSAIAVALTDVLSASRRKTARAALEVLHAAVDLPELWGTTEVADHLGTTTSSLPKWKGLPEPLYSRTHEDPRRRIKAGTFWDADAIRAFKRDRDEAAAS